MGSHSSWTAPQDYRTRPVAILGGGVLGRRIAACWVSAGYNVTVRDPDASTASACRSYVHEKASSYPGSQGGKLSSGKIETFQDLKSAVSDAWLVIEAIPEKLQLKIDTFAELESITRSDAILATNSSSYKSSSMLTKVSDGTKTRILNMHYYMPPVAMVVELMTDGVTDPNIIAFLPGRLRDTGCAPFVARKESTGLIFNRLWAAVKREVLTILADGVSVPKEIDELWLSLLANSGSGPCKMMDEVGLDTVAFIEDHYIAERGLDSNRTVDYLRKSYVEQGRLGNKSQKGGLYPRLPQILVLDVGLAAPQLSSTGGFVLQLASDGSSPKVLVESQSLPDGIDVDTESGRMFWTCMGMPGKGLGELYSAKLDGSDVKVIVPKGIVNTPKQLTVEPVSKKLYFTDREGMSVLRSNYDGSQLEVLVRNGDWKTEGFEDQTKWCVGIAVSPKLGKFYWTQKGFSKSGKGRIFCADIDAAPGSRLVSQLVQDNLPEPIDLEIDEQNDTIYWTDRGELPFGNSVNRAKLDASSGLFSNGYEVIVRHLNEAIGIKLDCEARHMYLTDLGGTLYRCNMDGTDKEKIYTSDERALTGVTLI